MTLEKYFEKFRKNIIGINAEFETPFGSKKMVYADWIASGRLYEPIEELIAQKFGPMVGNTHSEASETGITMTMLYKQAKQIIKDHVNANEDDCIITEGSGMTGAIHKLLRLLGLNIPDQAEKYIKEEFAKEDVPVVFLTYLEHHSNHTSWLETIADVVVLLPETPEDDLISEL